MKTYPQPTRSAASNAAIVEIPARGNQPARRGSFWPGENFSSYTHKWDLSGPFIERAFVLPSLLSNRGPQTF